MAAVRESVFIPTIKCSSCAKDVEISKMGDHICSGGDDTAKDFETSNEQQMIEIAFDDRPVLPPFTYGGERMPPAVDTTVANRQYMRPDQYTPISSSSESRSISPRTPTARSATGQAGDYFVPQIANDYPRATPSSQAPPMGSYGAYEEPETYDDSVMSPRMQASGNIYGQVDARAPNAYYANEKPLPLANDYTTTQGEYGSAPYWPETSPSTYRPPMPESTYRSLGNGNGDGTGSGQRPEGNRRPPRPRRPDDAMPEELQVGYISRSDTFPKITSPMKSPMRQMSAPITTQERERQSGSAEDRKRPSMSRVTSRAPPPRTNLTRPTTADHLAKSSVDLAAEFGIANPYHAPSDSASSGYSITSSRTSQTTAQTSPTRSYQSQKPSYSYNGDETESLQSSMQNLRTTDLRVDPAAPSSPEPYSAYTNSPSDVWPGSVPQGNANPSTQNQNLPPHSRSPSSRLEPSPKLKTDFSTSAAPRPFRNDSLPAHMHVEASPISPLSSGSQGHRKDSYDLSVPSSRGECKSCRLPIKGKSISSADGRLTGKYHKACFVCSTCFEPFASAEFYVLDDKPYCERHYHKLNGSLCGSCGRGIEGQYLEDEARVKYHPGCFRCLDCGSSLSDGYFDVDGKAYCERHAWRRVQHAWNHQPNKRQPESDVQDRPPPPPKGPSAPRPPRTAGGLPSNPRAKGGSLSVPRTQPGQQGEGRSHPSIVLMGLEPPVPRMNKRNTRLGMI